MSATVFAICMSRLRFITKPPVMTTFALIVALFFVVAGQDHNFRLIISKGDNMPIVIMIFAIMGSLWLGLRQAAVNDMRIERGEAPMEAVDGGKKVLVWPDLVFSEFII